VGVCSNSQCYYATVLQAVLRVMPFSPSDRPFVCQSICPCTGR